MGVVHAKVFLAGAKIIRPDPADVIEVSVKHIVDFQSPQL